ncbi:MAG: hypothetical protein JWM80_4199 [Cyanobacteria bacterium RYN_339]|nr:hypothetical protein [Cyanobacteria bacterium RYN_339]
MDALEFRIDEALCPELAQALVMLYCRHLGQPEARRTLRIMAMEQPELGRQFDALDELHARHPFRDLGRDALQEELRMLYRHHVALDAPRVVRQLRRLCQHEATLLAQFDAFDREFGSGTG